MDKAKLRNRVIVRDLMTPCVRSLRPGQTLEDAARLFTNERVSGAPVVRDDGHLVGVICKTDLLEQSPFIRHSPRAHVSDEMTRAVVTVRGNDLGMSAVRLMASREIHRVIVVDDNDRPMGIVSTFDVLAAIVRGDPLQAGDAAFEDRRDRHGEPAVVTAVDVSPNRG